MCKLSVLLLCGFIITACQSMPGSSAASYCPSDGVDFPQLFEQRYVLPFKEGRAADWATVFASDAVALHNRRPADIGIDKITAFGELVADTFVLAQYDVDVVDTRVGCDWAISHGNFTSAFVFRETGEAAPWGPESGKFLIAWEHSKDSGWKIVADMGNSIE